MIYPPGQGKSGDHLMQLWRDYLEQYADKEDDVEGQIVVAAYHSVEILTALSRALDKNSRYRNLIDERSALFHEGVRNAADFMDCMINATFSIYNSLNTISHQMAERNPESAALIRSVDEQAHKSADSKDPVERCAAAMRAGFPLLGLVTIALDPDQAMIGAIRQVERRFSAGAKAASSGWERLLNALYRVVEMMQIFALLTDPDLKDQINQIATRFQEEDQTKELRFKLRNGFCRLFELSHILTGQVDSIL
jgi:hypothetical protein